MHRKALVGTSLAASDERNPGLEPIRVLDAVFLIGGTFARL